MTLSAKHRKWLAVIKLASKPSSRSMYRGEREDLIPPKVLRSFEERGFVTREFPHNPVHKERIVITSEGIAALSAVEGE